MNNSQSFCYFHSLTKFSENFFMLQEWFKNSISQTTNTNFSIPVLNNPSPYKRRRKHSYKSRKNHRSKRVSEPQVFLNVPQEMPEEDASDDEEEEEFEVSEEWGKLLEISAKHRSELKKQRLQEEKKSEPKPEINVLAEFTELTTQMKELYGANSAMIHGMETSLQINHDKYIDGKQPKFWPVIPFNS